MSAPNAASPSNALDDRMRSLIVCQLDDDSVLMTNIHGEPFVGEYGACYTLEPNTPNTAWAKAVDAWLRQPEHDCLRARGDRRWQAACSAAQRINPETGLTHARATDAR